MLTLIHAHNYTPCSLDSNVSSENEYGSEKKKHVRESERGREKERRKERQICHITIYKNEVCKCSVCACVNFTINKL